MYGIVRGITWQLTYVQSILARVRWFQLVYSGLGLQLVVGTGPREPLFRNPLGLPALLEPVSFQFVGSWRLSHLGGVARLGWG